jgi:hypothetical protein
MPKEPTPTNATAAFVAALKALHNPKANAINPAFKAKYVKLDALLDAIKEGFADHDVALVQFAVSDENKVGIVTFLQHGASGETLPKEPRPLMVSVQGITEQQLGSKVTYLRRMTASTLCGISVDTDDDGAAASRPTIAGSGRPWSAFIPADLTDKAKAYVVGKGWLKDGQQLTDLPQEHVMTILGNQTAFLNVIRR